MLQRRQCAHGFLLHCKPRTWLAINHGIFAQFLGGTFGQSIGLDNNGTSKLTSMAGNVVRRRLQRYQRTVAARLRSMIRWLHPVWRAIDVDCLEACSAFSASLSHRSVPIKRNCRLAFVFDPGGLRNETQKLKISPPVVCFHLVLFFWRGKHGCEPPASPLCIGCLLTMIANATSCDPIAIRLMARAARPIAVRCGLPPYRIHARTLSCEQRLSMSAVTPKADICSALECPLCANSGMIAPHGLHNHADHSARRTCRAQERSDLSQLVV